MGLITAGPFTSMTSLFLTNILWTRSLAYFTLVEIGGQGGYTINLSTGLPDLRAQTAAHLCPGSLAPRSPDLQGGVYILTPHGHWNSSIQSRCVQPFLSTYYVPDPTLCMGIQRRLRGGVPHLKRFSRK